MRLLLGGMTAICVALMALPGSSWAARDAEVAIMDDQLLLGNGAFEVDGAMQVFRDLGVDRVRVSAFWRDHAPAPKSRERPPGFQAHDHAAAGYRWQSLDRVVAAALRHDLKVLISITTPAPIWASSSPRRDNPVWKPKPVEFARFAEAVAARYGPYVDMFAVMNEPNQGAWLQPQSDRRGSYAPHLYRRMLHGAYPRIKRHAPAATVLAGELASSGRDDAGRTRPIRPLRFLRELGCRDRRYRPLRVRRCRGFEPPPADAIGHHPYKFAGRPSRRSRERDDAAIGDWRRLLRTLDALTRRGALDPRAGRRLDVYYTEFGYQTDPPDPYSGISLRAQDRYLQHAAYLAYRTPRVRGLTQFRLTDGALKDARGRSAFGEFQSGLLFHDKRPKVAYYNFPDPFWISTTRPRRGSKPYFWGQVRPAGRHEVELQYRSKPGRRWRAIARATTSGRGYFARRLRARSGQYRFSWPGGRSAARAVRVR